MGCATWLSVKITAYFLVISFWLLMEQCWLKFCVSLFPIPWYVIHTTFKALTLRVVNNYCFVMVSPAVMYHLCQRLSSSTWWKQFAHYDTLVMVPMILVWFRWVSLQPTRLCAQTIHQIMWALNLELPVKNWPLLHWFCVLELHGEGEWDNT